MCQEGSQAAQETRLLGNPKPMGDSSVQRLQFSPHKKSDPVKMVKEFRVPSMRQTSNFLLLRPQFLIGKLRKSFDSQFREYTPIFVSWDQ
jgi:hypothetical protein